MSILSKLKQIVSMGVDGFKCIVCGAPSGDKICPDCKKKVL